MNQITAFEIMTFVSIFFLAIWEIYLQWKNIEFYKKFQKIWDNDEKEKTTKISFIVAEYSVLVNNNGILRWILIPSLAVLVLINSFL